MRITFVLPGFARKPVGGYRVVYEYANRLASRGHRVTLIHPALLPRGSHPPGGGIAMALRRALDGLAALIVRPRPSWVDVHEEVETRFVPVLRPAALPDADVVIATWWATAPFVADLPASRGAKAHLIQHFEEWGGPEGRVAAAWRLPLFKIVVSGWLEEKAMALGARPDQVLHIPNAIDHDLFRVHRPIAERGLSVAFMAAPEWWKGADDAIATVQRVKARLPALEAWAFGTEPRPSRLPDWVRYVRRPTSPVLARDVYGEAAVFLYTSISEGWGLPGAEAMACGCALVSTDNGGVRDYVRDGETGVLCAPGDTEALSAALESLLRDPARRVALAAAGERSIRRFTWDRSADVMERTLARLTGVEPERRPNDGSEGSD